ncbi:MAG: hypothetical protein RLY66_661 [Candidatus Parcubacteria bacterium]
MVFLAALVIGLIFLPNKFTTKVDVADESSWKTFSDPSTGISFRYPESLPTTYIHAIDWPPQARVLSDAFSCTDAGQETARAGKTESRTIGGKNYCVTTLIEGAAGSTYSQYAYVTSYKNGTAVFTFTTQSPQCANYDGPQQVLCNDERSAFDLDGIVDSMMSTLEKK